MGCHFFPHTMFFTKLAHLEVFFYNALYLKNLGNIDKFGYFKGFTKMEIKLTNKVVVESGQSFSLICEKQEYQERNLITQMGHAVCKFKREEKEHNLGGEFSGLF